MEGLYRDTRRLIVECRNMYEALEHASTNRQLDPLASRSVVERFHENLTVLEMKGGELRREMTKEPPSRRQVWKARLKDLEDQVTEFRIAEAGCTTRLRSIAREQQMREDLLERRRYQQGDNNNTSITINGLEGSGGGPSNATLRAGEEARRLDHSGSVVGNIINTGKDALTSLTTQRDRLRGARKKMLDVLHQIGVDRQIIARIERRERSDMILVYGLMATLLVLLGFAVLWKYHRRRVSA